MQNLPDLKNQLSQKDLFDAFKKQLAKDLEQSNFPAAFVEDLAPNFSGIREEIAWELQREEAKPGFNLMRLVNRIDISETQLKRYLSEHQQENQLKVIAELIIKRVLQKVVIRQHYKER